MQTLQPSALPPSDYPEVGTDKHLPEAVATPERSKQKYLSVKEVVSDPNTQIFDPVPIRKQKRWTRWPFLLGKHDVRGR